jgi:hypothetical protein
MFELEFFLESCLIFKFEFKWFVWTQMKVVIWILVLLPKAVLFWIQSVSLYSLRPTKHVEGLSFWQTFDMFRGMEGVF